VWKLPTIQKFPTPEEFESRLKNGSPQPHPLQLAETKGGLHAREERVDSLFIVSEPFSTNLLVTLLVVADKDFSRLYARSLKPQTTMPAAAVTPNSKNPLRGAVEIIPVSRTVVCIPSEQEMCCSLVCAVRLSSTNLFPHPFCASSTVVCGNPFIRIDYFSALSRNHRRATKYCCAIRTTKRFLSVVFV